MDTLSDVLSSVSFKSAMYGLVECAAPWGVRMPEAQGHVRLFMVVRGGCLVQFSSEKPVSLAAGELILSRNYSACEIKDAPGSAVRPIEESCSAMPTRGHVLKLGGGSGAASTLMLGCFTMDAQKDNPFLGSLPSIIHLKSPDVQAEPGLEATMRLLVSEISGSGPGGDILVARLSDAIFVQIVRAYVSQIKQCKETPGWLKALTDSQIGAALNLIHEKPEAPWTVATLADAVNMSRTSFATKFSSLVNETPIDYLTSWRMQKAVTLLRADGRSVEDISTAVGYTSRAAFAKAFKKEFGRSPGEFRNSLPN